MRLSSNCRFLSKYLQFVSPQGASRDPGMDFTKQISGKCVNYIVGGTRGTFAFSMGYMKHQNLKDSMDFCGESLKLPKDAC
jgi:hypothetical protein